MSLVDTEHSQYWVGNVKRWVLWVAINVEGAEVVWWGELFQTWAAATGKAWSSMGMADDQWWRLLLFAETGTATICDLLHWLPVPQHALFKIAMMAFDCARAQGPGYFHDVLVPVHTVTACARLWYANHGHMIIPRSHTLHYGQRSFHSSAPSVWSDLLSELKDSDICRQCFKSRLQILAFWSCLLVTSADGNFCLRGTI